QRGHIQRHLRPSAVRSADAVQPARHRNDSAGICCADRCIVGNAATIGIVLWCLRSAFARHLTRLGPAHSTGMTLVGRSRLPSRYATATNSPAAKTAESPDLVPAGAGGN